VRRDAQSTICWTDEEQAAALEHARSVGYAEFSPFVRDCVHSEIARSKASGYPYPPPIVISQRRVERFVRRRIQTAAQHALELPVAIPLPVAASDDDDDEIGG
jgi:hypothetical protein